MLSFTRQLDGRQEVLQAAYGTSVMLDIRNITKEDIEKHAHSAPYMCFRNFTCVDSIFVHLDYYPMPATDLQCRIHDFDSMECSWSLGSEYKSSTEISCAIVDAFYSSDRYSQGECILDRAFTECEEKNRTSCRPIYTAPSKFVLKVVVSNTFRDDVQAKVTCQEFQAIDIVEPRAVEDLKALKTGDPGCLEVTWRFSNPQRNYTFTMNYTSVCSSPMTKKIYYQGNKNVSDVKVDICGLIPSTFYTFSVSRRVTEDTIEKGFSSRWQHVTQITESDVIQKAPETLPGLHEFINVEGQPTKKAFKLYWKPLSDCELHDESRLVTYTVHANNWIRTVSHPSFEVALHDVNSRDVNISIWANNSVGTNSDYRYSIHTKGIRPSKLLIEYNMTQNSCTVFASILPTEPVSRYKDVSHTIVWCKGNQLMCLSPPEWKGIDSNVMFVRRGSCGGYRYGVVTSGLEDDHAVTSGLHWEPCAYHLGKKLDKAVEGVAMGKIQPDQGFVVVWKPYDCQITNVYIVHYVIKYCRTAATDTCTCTQPSVFVNVSSESDTYIVTDLEAGTQICAWVAGLTKSGIGPFNEEAVTHIITNKAGSVTVLAVLLTVGCLAMVVIIVFFLRCYLQKLVMKWKQNTDIKLPETYIEKDMPQNDETDSSYQATKPNTTPSGRDEQCPLLAQNNENTLPGYQEPSDVVKDISNNSTTFDQTDYVLATQQPLPPKTETTLNRDSRVMNDDMNKHVNSEPIAILKLTEGEITTESDSLTDDSSSNDTDGHVHNCEGEISKAVLPKDLNGVCKSISTELEKFTLSNVLKASEYVDHVNTQNQSSINEDIEKIETELNTPSDMLKNNTMTFKSNDQGYVPH